MQGDGVSGVQVQQDLIGKMAQGHYRGHSGGRVGGTVDEQAGAAGQGCGGVDVVGQLIAPGVGHREHRVPSVDCDIRGEQLAVRQGDQCAAHYNDEHCAAGVGREGGGGGDVGPSGPGGTSSTSGPGGTSRASSTSGARRTHNTCRAGGPRGSRRASGSGGPGRASKAVNICTTRVIPEIMRISHILKRIKQPL